MSLPPMFGLVRQLIGKHEYVADVPRGSLLPWLKDIIAELHGRYLIVEAVRFSQADFDRFFAEIKGEVVDSGDRVRVDTTPTFCRNFVKMQSAIGSVDIMVTASAGHLLCTRSLMPGMQPAICYLLEQKPPSQPQFNVSGIIEKSHVDKQGVMVIDKFRITSVAPPKEMAEELKKFSWKEPQDED